ncbi:phosphoglycerate kinase [Candidatus Saccharibacteria bacterium]|nr:phosphoglycerate kinase [Candidatus Saccharibacteria bacterium]
MRAVATLVCALLKVGISIYNSYIMFTKKTVKDIEIKNKRVLLRADYNVPINSDGTISDDYRIKQSLKTIKYLLKQGCKIIICSHLGRPRHFGDPQASLLPVAKRLANLLDQEVIFAEDCTSDQTLELANNLKFGDILMLQNLRYYPEEEANDAKFAKELARLADVFVQDGFGVVHRAHASTSAITKHLPSVAGLLLAEEVSALTAVIEKPARPLMAVIGGAKISDKIGVLNRLIDIADFVVVGGAMSNTFLLAQGIKVGKSLADKSDIPLAKEIIARARAESKKRHFVFYLPQDGVVSKKNDPTATTRIVDWSTRVIADIESYPKTPKRSASEVADNEMILDVGPFSGAFIAGGIQLSNTVIWNGALGVTETPALHGPVGPYAHGTDLLVDALLGDYGHRPFTVVGGGDTVGYIESRKLTDAFDHVSTGGGASLELMSGKKLPGIEALLAVS